MPVIQGWTHHKQLLLLHIQLKRMGQHAPVKTRRKAETKLRGGAAPIIAGSAVAQVVGKFAVMVASVHHAHATRLIL